MNIILGTKKYQVEVADTIEKQQKGLQNVSNLNSDHGMIFIYTEPDTRYMWMKNTLIPLDIVYINEDQEVIAVEHGQPEDNTLLSHDDTMYVVELNQGSGVKEGDELEFLDDDDYVMSVLKQDGTSQMDLKGGERIVSRRETKVLIRKAKKALDSHSENDYKSLGKYIFKVFKKQDERKPDYVESPK